MRINKNSTILKIYLQNLQIITRCFFTHATITQLKRVFLDHEPGVTMTSIKLSKIAPQQTKMHRQWKVIVSDNQECVINYIYLSLRIITINTCFLNTAILFLFLANVLITYVQYIVRITQQHGSIKTVISFIIAPQITSILLLSIKLISVQF